MAGANLAPFWDLRINRGQRLPEGVRGLIRSVAVDASVDGADELTIKADAYHPTGTAADRWALVGSTWLAAGNLATVYGGYADGDALHALQRFRLVAERTRYRQGGAPTVEIRGYSALARLAEATEPRAWEGPIADSVIARDLAEAHGLRVEIEDTPERREGRIKPRGTTDLAFLRGLAAAWDYAPPLVRYDEDQGADVLTFGPLRVRPGEARRYVYDPVVAGVDRPAGSVLSFDASLDLHGVPTRIAVGGWDPYLQRPVVVVLQVSADGQDPVILTGSEAEAYELHGASSYQARALEDSDDPRDAVTDSIALPSTITSVEDAVAWARRWARLRSAAFLTARAKVIGDPRIWPGQVHRFEGLAPTHVGLWEVLGARHEWTSGGYTVDLDLGRVLEAPEPVEV